MPAWLIKALVDIAISIGVPALIKYLPWIPKEVVQIIEKLVEALKGSNDPSERRELKKNARECVGVACKPNLKR